MIYKQQSVSDSYFKLLLEEAVRRDLDCKIIAKEILDFKKFITGSSIYYSIADESIAKPTPGNSSPRNWPNSKVI
jgi:hypothetical protein